MIEIENSFIVMVIGGTNLRPKPEDDKSGLPYRQAIVQNSVEVFDIENGWTWSQGMLRNFFMYSAFQLEHTFWPFMKQNRYILT